MKTAINTPTLPVLYTFRRCPYALRARLALAFAEQAVEPREVDLKNKPRALLEISPKGTVPVLQLPSGEIIEQSLDIMRWALAQHDPAQLLASLHPEIERLLQDNDMNFKFWLDRYKYADRFPEDSAAVYRARGEEFLCRLETLLTAAPFLGGTQAGFADIAIMPFVRQFASVDKAWFARAPYPALQAWLANWLRSDVLAQVMKKHAPWQEGVTGA